MSVKADLAKILLNTPAATEIGEKVALSRRIDKHWRLIGEFWLARSHHENAGALPSCERERSLTVFGRSSSFAQDGEESDAEPNMCSVTTTK